MKKLSIITLALMAAGAAFAESPTADDTATQSWAQTKTRAQVQDELLQARADGSIKVWSTQYNPLVVAKPVKSREQVRDELMAARASGEKDAMTGEDSGSSYLARLQPSGRNGDLRVAGTARVAK